jgi:hypothetical protein
MKKEPQNRTPEAWTQHELELLHEMVRDYSTMKLLKRKIWLWGVWLVGLPAAVLTVWEPLARLLKLLKGG